MSAALVFTPADRQRFAELKESLPPRLRRLQPQSADVYSCAVDIAEISARAYHLLDGTGKMDDWCREALDMVSHQANKYLRVAQAFSLNDLAGRHLGIEALDQIALASPLLRAKMFALAEQDRLSAGALCAGRLAAAGLLRRDLLAQALLRLERAAHQRAKAEVEERRARKERAQAAPEAQLAAALERDATRLELLVNQPRGLSEEARLLLERHLERLVILHQRLAAPTFETSAGPKEPPDQAVVGPPPAQDPPPPVEAPVPLVPAPLVEWLAGDLPERLRIALAERLFNIILGEPPRLKQVLQALCEATPATQEPPWEEIDGFRAALRRAEPEARAVAALRLAVAARLPQLDVRLPTLHLLPLAKRVAAEARALAATGLQQSASG